MQGGHVQLRQLTPVEHLEWGHQLGRMPQVPRAVKDHPRKRSADEKRDIDRLAEAAARTLVLDRIEQVQRARARSAHHNARCGSEPARRTGPPTGSCGTKLRGAPGLRGAASPVSGSGRGCSGSVGVIKGIVKVLRL